MIIFFDTETTGLYPGRIIQLSYIIDDKDKVTAKNFFFAVDYIEPSAIAVHGFTVERLKELSQGKTFQSEMDEIYDDFLKADLIVGHNVKFDIGFMIAEFNYADRIFRYNESFDTMKAFTPIMKLKRSSHKSYKFPKLTELTEFLDVYPYDINKKLFNLYGLEMLSCHDARYDTVALYLAFIEGISRYPEIKNQVNKCLEK